MYLRTDKEQDLSAAVGAAVEGSKLLMDGAPYKGGMPKLGTMRVVVEGEEGKRFTDVPFTKTGFADARIGDVWSAFKTWRDNAETDYPHLPKSREEARKG